MGIFGQPDLWDLSVLKTYGHPGFPHDVAQVFELEREEQERDEKLRMVIRKIRRRRKSFSRHEFIDPGAKRTSVAPLPRLQESPQRRIRTPDALNPTFNSWYSKSICAKELVLDKIPRKRMPAGAQAITKAMRDKGQGSLRLYQYLDPYELESIRLPGIKGKLDFSGFG